MPGSGRAVPKRRHLYLDRGYFGAQCDQPFICSDARFLRGTALDRQRLGRRVRQKTVVLVIDSTACLLELDHLEQVVVKVRQYRQRLNNEWTCWVFADVLFSAVARWDVV